MAKRGLFGKIVHCEGGYHHDLRHSVPDGFKTRSYRLRNYLNVNSHNYPTHDFGPIAKILGINRGNRALSLVSMSSGSFGMEDFIARHRADEEDVRGRDFALGDIVTIQDNNIGVYVNARIREAIEVQDENGYSVEVIYQ